MVARCNFGVVVAAFVVVVGAGDIVVVDAVVVVVTAALPVELLAVGGCPCISRYGRDR